MRRVCRQCKIFFETETCPLCKGTDFATSWNGRVNILSTEKSIVAKHMGIGKDGDYAIKVR